MSSSNYTLTPNLGLYKPNYDMDDGQWGAHLNANADALDAAIHFASGGGPFLPLAGGILIGPTYITATGSSASRSLQARAADVANVLDYGAGVGGDDALAIRNAIASNKQLIFIPPGTYTMKSVVPTFGSATGPCAFQLNNRQDTWIIAYGATFLIDNSVSSPAAGAPATLSICNNCKNVGILGGTFVGNPTGLLSTQENIGIILNGVTGLTIRDVKFTGTFFTSIAGVYAFDSVIEDCEGYNNANGIDVSHLENVVFRGCRFQADTANRFTGLSLHYDMPTLGDNTVTNEDGTARTLQGGYDNNVRVLDCMFVGYLNGIAINEINGCLISRTILKGGLGSSAGGALAGINLYCDANATTAGLKTTSVTIEDCDIYGNGNTASIGAGINFNANAGTISNINILNNRIYDNTASGISASTGTGMTGIVIAGNDFRTRGAGTSPQTAAILSGFAAVLAAGAAGNFNVSVPLVISPSATIGTGIGTPTLTLNGAAGTNKAIAWQGAGISRWTLQNNNTDDVLGLYAYTSAGAFLDKAFEITQSTKTLSSNFQLATVNTTAPGVNGISGVWFQATNTGVNPSSGHKFNYNSKAGQGGFDCGLVHIATFDPVFIAGQNPAEGGAWFVSISPNDQTHFFGCNVAEWNIVNRGPDGGWHRDRLGAGGTANPTGGLLMVAETLNFGVATGGEGKNALYAYSVAPSALTNSTGFPAKFYNGYLIEPNSVVGLTGRAIYATGDITGTASQYPYGPLQLDGTWLHGIDHTKAVYTDGSAQTMLVGQSLAWIVGATGSATATATIAASGSGANASLALTAAGTGTITLAGPIANAQTLLSTLRVNGNVGFYNTAPIAKPTAGGAWAGNTAGKALSTALAALGLITDTSTA